MPGLAHFKSKLAMVYKFVFSGKKFTATMVYYTVSATYTELLKSAKMMLI